jgi:endonuclease/exonuclease/phosphatase family metal-dependent hydrolase
MGVLLSWNVAGRVALQEEQIEVVLGRDADVVCLQEVTPRTAPRWPEALGDGGYTVQLSTGRPTPGGLRRLAVLTAAKAAPAVVPGPVLRWPERHLACRVALEGAQVEVRNVHAPLSQKAGRVKVRTLEAVFSAVARDDGLPRVVAGDLNTPRYESRTDDVFTFARTRSGRLRPAYGERHDRAELALIAELPARGWRLDHLIVSPELEPVGCDYVHEWRERGLSDHSAIWAEIRLSQC